MNSKGKNLTYRNLFGSSVWRLSVILAGTVLVTAGNVFLRWCVGNALDQGEISVWLLAVAGGLLVVTQAIGFHKQILSAKVQKNICHRLQSKVLHGCLTELEKNDMGEITTYYIADVSQIDSFTGRILTKAFPDVIGWLITVALMFGFDLFLGIAAIVVTVLPACLVHRMSRPIAKGTDEYQDALGEANQSVVSGLHNIETIKASCKEERFLQDNREKLAELQQKKRAVAIWEALLGAPMLLVAFLIILLMTGLGAWFVFLARISVGQLLTVVTLIDNIVTFVMSLEGTISAYRRASVSRKRLDAFLGLAEERVEEERQEQGRVEEERQEKEQQKKGRQEKGRQGGREPGQIREIVFDRIFFAYPNTGKEIYHGFSESWRQGKICFVQGGNGEGKSTLVKLLLGVYRVCGGEIVFNGIPMDKCRLGSLRERIVVAPQENVLFRGSIYDNLACGQEIGLTRAEEICKKVGIHDEIIRMPDQYETVLSENGGVLSGGQKQRLCLARALLREGDVYIFDEPTSALDARHGEILMELLEELARERIVVVITHEKEFLDSAERIMRIGGREG